MGFLQIETYILSKAPRVQENEAVKVSRAWVVFLLTATRKLSLKVLRCSAGNCAVQVHTRLTSRERMWKPVEKEANFINSNEDELEEGFFHSKLNRLCRQGNGHHMESQGVESGETGAGAMETTAGA